VRVLGIDFGDRHLGLALSDVLRVTAQPFGTYSLSALESENIRFFRDLVARNDVGEIVIGDPLRMDGSQGTRARKTREFGAWLEQTVGRPVFFMDERLTTREALHILRGGRARGRERKEREDQISAVIILSTYLERKQSETHGPQAG
jgi:putative Holliday junction resolvase